MYLLTWPLSKQYLLMVSDNCNAETNKECIYKGRSKCDLLLTMKRNEILVTTWVWETCSSKVAPVMILV